MPIVVLIPPIMVAKPIGIRIFDGAVSVRCATPTRIGSIMTTIGVLFANALMNAALANVARSANAGFSTRFG